MRKYEVMYIIRPDVEQEAVQALSTNSKASSQTAEKLQSMM